MTSQQDAYIMKFESEVRTRGENAEMDWKESSSPQSRGALFGNFKGVTLIVYPEGVINIPAVCTYGQPKYPTPAIAAASAKELWAGQKRRDDANPNSAKHRAGGASRSRG